jgi:hypothetical protein
VKVILRAGKNTRLDVGFRTAFIMLEPLKSRYFPDKGSWIEINEEVDFG